MGGALIAVAPSFLPTGYNLIRQTVSESAAQRICCIPLRLRWSAFGMRGALLAAAGASWPRLDPLATAALVPVLAGPALMMGIPSIAGLVQRVMFAVVALWLAASLGPRIAYSGAR